MTGNSGLIVGGRRRERTRRVSLGKKPGETAGLRFHRVDRKRLVAQSAGMGDVVGAAAERPIVPGVEQIEHQRRIDGNCGVQATRRLPGAIAHAGDKFAERGGRRQWHAAAIAS